MVASHHRFILYIKLSKTSWSKSYHYWINICFSYQVFSGWYYRAVSHLSKASCTCSMGFKSEMLSGQSIMLLSSLSKSSSTAWDRCGRELSSIKAKSIPMAHRNRRTWRYLTSSQLRFPISEPLSKIWSSAHSLKIISSHTSTSVPPQQFSFPDVCRMKPCSHFSLHQLELKIITQTEMILIGKKSVTLLIWCLVYVFFTPL